MCRVRFLKPSPPAAELCEPGKITGFLAGHALLDPLVAATVLLPSGTSAFEGERGIGNFLHPLVADFGQPKLDRLSFRAGHTLDEAQLGLGSGDIGEAHLAVVGG